MLKKNVITINGAIVKFEDLINANSNEISLLVPGGATTGPLIVRVFGKASNAVPLSINPLRLDEFGRIYWIPGVTASPPNQKRVINIGSLSITDNPSGKLFFDLDVRVSGSVFAAPNNATLDPKNDRLYFAQALGSPPTQQGIIAYLDLKNKTLVNVIEATGYQGVRANGNFKVWVDPERNLLYFVASAPVNNATYMVTLDANGKPNSPPQLYLNPSEGIIIGMSKSRIFFLETDNDVASTTREPSLEYIVHPALFADNRAGANTTRPLIRNLLTNLDLENVHFIESEILLPNNVRITSEFWRLVDPANNTQAELLYKNTLAYQRTILTPEHLYFLRRTSTGWSISRLKNDGSSAAPLDIYSNLDLPLNNPGNEPVVIGTTTLFIDTEL